MNTHTWLWHNASHSPHNIKWMKANASKLRMKKTWHQFINAKADITSMMKNTGSNILSVSAVGKCCILSCVNWPFFKQHLNNWEIKAPAAPHLRAYVSPTSQLIWLPFIDIGTRQHTCLFFGNSFHREVLGGEERVGLMGPGIDFSLYLAAHIFVEHYVSGSILVSMDFSRTKLIEHQAQRESLILGGEMNKNTNYASQKVESVLKQA